jgi:hypothetical protein
MAVLARLWFHNCPASGWVLAERTGLRVKATGDTRPTSFVSVYRVGHPMKMDF